MAEGVKEYSINRRKDSLSAGRKEDFSRVVHQNSSGSKVASNLDFREAFSSLEKMPLNLLSDTDSVDPQRSKPEAMSLCKSLGESGRAAVCSHKNLTFSSTVLKKRSCSPKIL